MAKTNRLDKGAIVQRDLETYSVSPHIAGGFCDPQTLRKIADVAEKYGAEYLKLTGSQRIAIIGVREENLDDIWSEFDDPTPAVGPCIRSIKICPGTRSCKKALQDSRGLGLALDKAFYGQTMPAKFKMGVSGCPNCCSDSWMKDIGLFGVGDGFRIIVGGKGGRAPVKGTFLADIGSAEETIKLVGRIIGFYVQNGKENERLGQLIERIGFGQFAKEII